MGRAERTLVYLLRLEGLILLCALPAVVMPTDWMDSIHQALGMGPLPRKPIVEYLTRSLSLVYGACGPVYLFFAANLRRYPELVGYLLILQGVFSALLIPLDLYSGLPRMWSAGEGPFLLTLTAVQWGMFRRLTRNLHPSAN